MKLTFSPDLGQTTKAKVAPVPSHIADRASCIHTILFKATFDSTQSYLRARSDRFRVELWTNFPVHEHVRHRGEWRAVQFMEPQPVQGTSASASAQSFNLLMDTDAEGKREENTLYLQLRAPLQDHIGARFSYTFRLVHASGHVEWLGSDNNNGTIVVEQGLPGVTLSKDWTVGEDGTFTIGEPLTGKPLVRLNRPKEWSGWVWKPFLSLPAQFAATDSCEGRAMVLLPCQSTDIGDLLNPLVVVAGESSSLRLSADGRITVDSVDSGTRQASLAVLEHAEGLLENVAALCNGVVLSFDATAIVIATHQSGAAAPSHIVVLPISDSLNAQSISLQKLQLQTASISEGQGLVLFSPKLRKAKLFHTPFPSDSILHIGPSGAELLVSPVSIIYENDRTWQVTLLTPSKGFTMHTERPAPQVLPTPPPSPLHDSSPVLDSTSSVIPDLDRSSTLPPLDDGTRPVRSPAPSGSNGAGARHSAHRRRRSLSMALVRSLPVRLVRAYLHAIFNIVFWFWSVFVRSFAVRLVGEGIPRIITRLLSLVLAKTGATRRSPGSGGASAPASGVEPSNSTRASQLEPTGAPSAASTDDSESGGGDNESTPDPTPSGLEARAHPESVVPVAAPSSLSLSSRPKEHGEAPRVVVSAELLQEPLSPLVLIHGPAPLKGVRGMFDGKLLPSPSVTPLEDGVFLVEFTEVDGKGELTVSFEL